MKLENRYIVLKVKDIEKFLTTCDERVALYDICESIDNQRKKEGRGSIDCLVIEKDWPEYEPTLKLLSERVDKENHENNK